MEAEKTIVMTTQVQNEGSNLSVYDVGFHLKNDLHLLEAYDMTTEAVVAKLMWILGQTRDPAEIRRLFCTPVSYDLLYLKREDKA
jgi:L-asparaginase